MKRIERKKFKRKQNKARYTQTIVFYFLTRDFNNSRTPTAETQTTAWTPKQQGRQPHSHTAGQCCGTGTGTVGTVTFCLVEPEPELEP